MPLDLSTTNPRRRPIPFLVSLGLHLVVTAWLLWISRPIFVAPTSVVTGIGGLSITHIYWPGAPAIEGSDVRKKSAGKLSPAAAKPLLPARKSPPAAEPGTQLAKVESPNLDSGSADRARSAGSPVGSPWADAMAGHVIRPALPAHAYDPVVNLDELHGREGDVVVEVTIDATGKIVAKTVLQSMGPEIDTRVLAALEGWQFLPATRDGVAIASKQDVYYHFPPHR